jgi:hypothetical protein
MGDLNILFARGLAHQSGGGQPDMVERVGDRLLEAAAGCRVEALDQAHRKCGLLGPGDLPGATTAQRLLDLVEDGLLDAGDLQWCQETVECLRRGVEDHLGVVQLDPEVVAVQAKECVAGDPGNVKTGKWGQYGGQTVADLVGEISDLHPGVGSSHATKASSRKRSTCEPVRRRTG